MVYVNITFTEDQYDSLTVASVTSSLLTIITVAYPAYKLWIEKRKEFSVAQRYFSVLILMNLVTAFMYLFGTVGRKYKGFCQFQAFIIQTNALTIQIWTVYISIKMYSFIVLRKSSARLLKHINRDVALVYTFSIIYAIIFLAIGAYGVESDWCWIDSSKDDSLRYWALYGSLMICMIFLMSQYIYITYFVKKNIDHEMAVTELRISRKITWYIWIFNFCWFWGLLNRLNETATGKTNFTLSLLQALFQPMQGLLNNLIYTNTHTKIYEYIYGEDDSTSSTAIHFQKNSAAKRGSILDIERGSMAIQPHDMDSFNSMKANMILDINDTTTDDSTFNPITDSNNTNRPTSVHMDVINYTELLNDMKAFSKLNSYEYMKILNNDQTGGTGVGINTSLNNFYKFEPKTYSIFVTTYNLGEAKATSLSDNIKDWLVPGYDIYSIGLQEALDMKSQRDLILAYLGGANEYKMLFDEIGSDNTRLGYHGYISINVFVKKSEYDKGFIRRTFCSKNFLTTGANLGGGVKAGNKGGVGIPLQIHDTNITFLTSHLTSDSKGARKTKKRNADCNNILKDIEMSPLDLGFSSHKQCDHFIFTGDLNYRIHGGDENPSDMTKGSAVCHDIALAARSEKNEINKIFPITGNKSWRDIRSNLLRHPINDKKSPDIKLIETLLKSSEKVSNLWKECTKNDELVHEISRGNVFCGFYEPPITFAPTYKRKVGKGPHCLHGGDYCDKNIMFDAFSNTEGMLKMDGTIDPLPNDKEKSIKIKKNMRPPSYTDRIVFHSLPDRASRLAVQSYDVCEEMVVSDHRPVSSALTLTVNNNIIYPENFVEELDIQNFNSTINKRDEYKIIGKSNLYLIQLTIKDLEFTLKPLSNEVKDAEGEGEGEGIHGEDIHGEDDEDIAISSSFNNKKIDENFNNVAANILEEVNISGKLTTINLDDDPVAIDADNMNMNANSTPSSSPSIPKKKMLNRRGTMTAIFDTVRGKKDKSEQSKTKSAMDIKSIRVVFPLPSKDPLVKTRRMDEIAKSFEVHKKSVLDKIQEFALQAVELKYKANKQTDLFDKESIVNFVSYFPCDSIRSDANTNIPSPSRISDVNDNDSYIKTVKCNPMCILGCVSPELGAHVLIGLSDSNDGDILGEILVSVDDMINTKNNSTKRKMFHDIPVTLGGVLRGTATGLFSVSLLTIVKLDEKDNSKSL
jgi:hypothetical protein